MVGMTRMTDAPVPLEDYVPSADRFVVLRGNWATYEALLAARREKRCPRISYLDGVLQVMSPSREHDLISRTLAALVTDYCAETSVDCTLGGSWTLRDALKEAGLEPDECFILGPAPDVKDRPDLAIEVIWTSGGIEKLEIYRRLGIGEVWFWQDNAIRVLVLRNDAYVQVDSSACLPAINVALVARLARVVPTTAAIREFRKAIRKPST